MNYNTCYIKLIEFARRQQRVKIPYDGMERHHIVPRSLGGSNKKENLVLLTPREHFIAHRLLIKIYVGKDRAKMVYALHRMMSNNAKQTRDNFITSRHYESVRQQYYLYQKEISSLRAGVRVHSEENKRKISERMKGDNNPSRKYGVWNKGKKNEYTIHSEEYKHQLSIKMKGRSVSDSTRQKISNAHKGKSKSNEHRQKLSIVNTGKVLSEDTRKKMSESRKGMIHKTIVCPHCHKEGGLSAMYRWHMNNCKSIK